MKNRKGFTLIELLVTIAIVAALFVSASFGLSTVLDNSRKKQAASYLKEIMESADTYIDLRKLEVSPAEQYIELQKIIKSGLLGDSILKINNPLSDSCESYFTNSIKIYYILDNNIKRIYIMDSNNNKCYLDRLDECEIRDC